MFILKSALSLTAVMAGLSVLAGGPAEARAPCKTRVVLVKKVVCDCGAPAHRVKAALKRTAAVHVTHTAVRHTSTVVRHTTTQTAWHEAPYPGRPAGVVYVDESSPPIYGGNRFVSTGAVMASSATYSRTVRITRSFGGAPGCGPCAGRPAGLTGYIDDGVYTGGVGYGGDSGYAGGGGYYSGGENYGSGATLAPATWLAFSGYRGGFHHGGGMHAGGGYDHGHDGGMHSGGYGHGGMHGGHMGGHGGGHW